MLLKRKVSVKRREFEFIYASQPVRYSVWLSDATAPITTVVFLGTVQIGRLPAWIAYRCPPGVAVVQGAPHWTAKADGSDMPVFMRQFTDSALENILRMKHDKRLHIIVDSQATPVVVELLSNAGFTGLVASLVLVQPLGLNPQAFAKNRIATFKKRVTKNFHHQLPFLAIDRRLIYNHGLILRTVGYDNPKSNAQYEVGLASDATVYLKKLQASGIDVTVICGEKDELFPPHEIRANLRSSGLQTRVLTVANTPHSPLPTKQGMRLFNRALEVVSDIKKG